MQAEVKALFDEHDKPTHCCGGDIHAGLAPVDRLAATVRKQILEYQSLSADISHADPYNAHGIDGVLEHLHQTYGAVEREAAAMAVAARELGKASKQLERYMADARAAIEQKDATAELEAPAGALELASAPLPVFHV